MSRIVTIGIGMLESISKIFDLAQKVAIEKFLIQLGIHSAPDMNWDQLCIMDHGKDSFQIPFEKKLHWGRGEGRFILLGLFIIWPTGHILKTSLKELKEED